MEEKNNYIIPRNFAQDGYIGMFRIVNVVEAVLIAAVFIAVAFLLPVEEATKLQRVLVAVLVAAPFCSVSLIGIQGNTFFRLLQHTIRNRKIAKVYGVPTEAYKREYNRQRLETDYGETKHRKGSVKHGKKQKS